MAALVPLGRFLFRYRNIAGPLILIIVLLTCQPLHVRGDPVLDAWMDIAGLLVVVLGLAVRAITIGYEYIVRGGRNKQVYADNLVQGGVFAHSRNPMYLGNLLIALGCAMIVNAWEFYLVALPLSIFLYASIIAAEEAYLREKFGPEYDDYRARVNRLLPRLTGFRKSVEGMHFNWRRVLVKDYLTIFIDIGVALALIFWDDYRILGSAGLPPTQTVLETACVWALLFIVVHLAVVRIKRAERLGEDHQQSAGAA